MRPKYLAFDLDGTLLNSNKKISHKTIEFLKQVDIPIILISSRHYYEMIKYVEILCLKKTDYIVSSDGQYIYNGEGELLYTNMFLSTRDVKQLLKESKQMDCKFYTDKSDYIYKNRTYTINNCIMYFFKDIVTFLSKKKKKEIHFLPLAPFLKIEKIVIYNKLDDFNTQDKYSVTVFDYRTEFTHKTVNKYSALCFFRDSKGIDLDTLLYFGDDINDLEVFNNIEHTVAMGNSSKKINEIAKYHTLSCDEDGVLFFLETIMN